MSFPTTQLKTILFELLENTIAPTPLDIAATQQLGVNLSNGIKRDGVVIVQNQNVEIYSRVVPSVIKALKLCDSFPVIEAIQQPLQIVASVDADTDPIDECCAWLYENSVGWEDMQDLMKARYAEFVIGRKGTKSEAAKMLKIQPSYLSKITSLLSIKNKVKEGETKNENKKLAVI